eukprot:g145.t1
MLNGSAEAGHTCVPSKWWAEYGSRYPGVGPCHSSCGASCPQPPSPPRIQLAPNGPRVTLVTPVLSNWADPKGQYTDPTLAVQELAAEATSSGSPLLAKWRSQHRAWWADFWGRSSVALPSAPLLEKQWYGSLYILASSHRTDGSADAVAPGIVWPKTSDKPAFRGAMTVNYNQQALYYGIYSANHADLGGAFYNAMRQYIPRGRKDSLAQFQCPGINMNCEIFHWGQSASGVGDQGQRSNAALAAVPFANHWLWTRDVQWLNQTGWQYMSEVAEFWECYLTRYGADYPGTPAGSFSSVNDCFNELCSSDKAILNVNPHITMSLLHFLFPVFLDAAQALPPGVVPASRQALWRKLHANLAPMTELRLPDGRVIFGGVLGSSNHPKTGDNPLITYLGWPGYDERLTTNSTLAKVLENTLDYLQSWTCGNCWPQYPPARVRMQSRAKDAADSWSRINGVLKQTIAANLIVMDGPGNMATAMEGAAGIATVNEMLLQSHTGRGIELFPQIPLGEPASFTNLRAKGGFLVSAALEYKQLNAADVDAAPAPLISGVVVRNEAKDGAASATVKMLSPWWPTMVQVVVQDVATKEAVPVTMGEAGWFSFSARNGAAYGVAGKAGG